MTFRHLQQTYPTFIFFAFAWLLPFAANSASEEVAVEKRIGVAMRMIGHEVLICLGDRESRIMPIEKIDDHYKISFEFEFGFDPDDIISIIERVMTKTRTATNYLVEVEQCETKEVVHSFAVGYAAAIPCGGRVLPEDCYSLLITILDGTRPGTNITATTPGRSSINTGPMAGELSDDGSPLAASETTKASPFKFAFLMLPLLFLLGVVGYFIKKNIPASQAAARDPNLLFIGAFQFDKRNMALSFENNKVELSNKEAELLAVLHTAANTPIEREVLLQRVWGDEGDYVGRTLDVFISKLRKKLEADASVKIVNIRGIGYKLVIDVQK